MFRPASPPPLSLRRNNLCDLSQAGADFPQDGVELEGEGAGAVAVAALPVEDGLLGKTN